MVLHTDEINTKLDHTVEAKRLFTHSERIGYKKGENIVKDARKTGKQVTII